MVSGVGGTRVAVAELARSLDGARGVSSVEGLELGWLMTKTIWNSRGVPQDPTVPLPEAEPADREEASHGREAHRPTGDRTGLAN